VWLTDSDAEIYKTVRLPLRFILYCRPTFGNELCWVLHERTLISNWHERQKIFGTKFTNRLETFQRLLMFIITYQKLYMCRILKNRSQKYNSTKLTRVENTWKWKMCERVSVKRPEKRSENGYDRRFLAETIWDLPSDWLLTTSICRPFVAGWLFETDERVTKAYSSRDCDTSLSLLSVWNKNYAALHQRGYKWGISLSMSCHIPETMSMGLSDQWAKTC